MSTRMPAGWGFGKARRVPAVAHARAVQLCLAQPRAVLDTSTHALARDLTSACGVSRATARRAIERAREIARCADSTLGAAA